MWLWLYVVVLYVAELYVALASVEWRVELRNMASAIRIPSSG